MPRADELAVDAELDTVRELARYKGWELERVTSTTFRLTMVAKDGSHIQLQVDCDGYPAQPPAWHFRNPATGALDERPDIPVGGTYFHGSGFSCAPWNRLAYAQVNPRGPHGDWDLGNWKANPYTFGDKTLAAMALRIHHELTRSYTGRQG